MNQTNANGENMPRQWRWEEEEGKERVTIIVITKEKETKYHECKLTTTHNYFDRTKPIWTAFVIPFFPLFLSYTLSTLEIIIKWNMNAFVITSTYLRSPFDSIRYYNNSIFRQRETGHTRRPKFTRFYAFQCPTLRFKLKRWNERGASEYFQQLKTTCKATHWIEQISSIWNELFPLQILNGAALKLWRGKIVLTQLIDSIVDDLNYLKHSHPPTLASAHNAMRTDSRAN